LSTKRRREMFSNGGFYNNYAGIPEETVFRAPPPREREREPPRQEEPIVVAPQPSPSRTIVSRPSSTGNGALIAQIGILAVIALFLFMKLNSS
jgi:hypothetical protein